MKPFGFSRVALCTSAALLIAGCGGSQAGAPAAPQPNDVRAQHPQARNGQTIFTTSGRSILLNGQPFYVKGVDYMNTQIDAYSDPNPLDDANEKLWKPDLDAMRAAGVNALKVYNVTLDSFGPYVPILGDGNKLKDYETGKIGKFLDAAWNNGDHPIYVVLSIYFGGDNVTNVPFLKALKAVYELTAKQYAGYPAVMGFSLGSEINSETLIVQPAWWKGLNELAAATRLGFRGANARKLITTTMVDMVSRDHKLATVVAGEKNNFTVDVWGIDSYRGYTFTNIWDQIKEATKRPEIMAEYGSSAAWWYQSSATYDQTTHECPKTTYPTGSFVPSPGPYWGLPPPRPWENVKDLPDSGNPQMQYLADQVAANAKELYDNSTAQGGVGSGGFYFEWNDEWSKAGWPHSHIGGFPGNVISPTPHFAGCYWDEAWFGLLSDKPVDRKYSPPTEPGNPFPARPADLHVPRPTLDAIKAEWAKE